MAGRARRRKDAESFWWLAAAALVAVTIVVQLVREHPVTASLIALALLAAAGGCGWWWLQRSRRLAVHERTVAAADVMSGSQFEHWVARLMRASGCHGVRVSGGAGDKGADVTGYAADGRRLVVQCKRYNGKVGSPDVQRFAGTAHQIHGADVALLVTTNYLTAQAADVARQCHILVIDRDVLGAWAASLTLPVPGLPASPPMAGIAAALRLQSLRRCARQLMPRPTRRVAAPTATAQPTPAPPAVPVPPTAASPGTDWWNEAP